ncbi:MAG TPA: low molecular weight phosphatase family protein [Actinomycetota bacterium]|nr:low molecular weight phosphatase family protein [Actinomycetota bacterium]
MHSRRVSQQMSYRVRKQTSEDVERPSVLFVCVHNAGRSRMAEAFFNQMAGDRYRGISAGTEPAERPHPEVVAAMEEVHLPIEDRPGTMLTQEMTDDALLVVGMGCAVEEACPALRVPLEDWKLDDPKGKSPQEVAEIRDAIEMRVRNLVARLDRERAAAGH